MKNLARAISSYLVVLCLFSTLFADVTIKQRVTMSGQRFESTRRIKGSRERTEQRTELADPSMAAYMPQIATITQCDLKRRIQVNDRKQLYFIEPFETPETETRQPARADRSTTTGTVRTGGTVTMTFNVRDTGERKMMFGLQARHIITTQETESSADSCNGPNRTKYEFDGWYVDFAADFSCPSTSVPYSPGRTPKPDCVDRIVRRGTGTAPKGMMLEGTMKIYGPDGSVQMTQTTETLELNRDPLAESLFDIPQGYKLAASSQDLYSVTMPTYAQNDDYQDPRSGNRGFIPPTSAVKTVSFNVSMAPGTSNQSDIESYVRSKVSDRGYRVVSGPADYVVNVQVNQLKESTASKVGGIFGKVTGVPTGGVGKVDVDLTATLSGKAKASAKVKDKFDSPLSAAIRMALDQAIDQLFHNLDQ